MGACVMVCAKTEENLQEPTTPDLQKRIEEQLSKSQIIQDKTDEIIQEEHITLELPSQNLSKSSKTSAKSRFYKEKMATSKNKCHTSEQTHLRFQIPHHYATSDLTNEQSAKRFRKFKSTKQFWIDDQQCNLAQKTQAKSSKSNYEYDQQITPINIRAKKVLHFCVDNLTQSDQRLVNSTKNIASITSINQKIYYKDGSYYFGQWKKGMRYGHGQYIWSDNTKYEGQWKNDRIQGYGVLYYDDGESYCGTFVNNQAHGKGQYIFKDGRRYVGEWMNSLFQGKGSEIFTNGQSYIGNWSKGKKHGYGQIYFSDGTYYKGQFSLNEIQGHGQYNYRDKVYEGQWQHNEKNGKGCLRWKNGSYYEGQFLHGKMHGNGKLHDENGKIYEGKWLNGKKQGIMIEHLPNGEKIKSQWYFNKFLRQVEKSI